MFFMSTFLTLYIFLFLCYFAYTDTREGRIPNKGLIFMLAAGMSWRVCCLFAADCLGNDGGFGSFGNGLCLLGTDMIKAILFLALLFPLHLIRAMGAGDIKLASVLAALCGMDAALPILYLSLLATALYSFILMVRRHILLSRIRYFHFYLNLLLSGVFIRYYIPERDRDYSFPMAPCFLAGYVIWMLGGFL